AALVVLALGLLVPLPRAAAADTFILDRPLPTLQSLAGRAQLQTSAQPEAVSAGPICDLFANGYDAVGAAPCASCFDNTINFDETDVDCGGTYCKACADGQQCLVASDCSSGVCNGASHLCAPATCIDNIKDGTETDVDCGGGICPATCAVGKNCALNVDCTS